METVLSCNVSSCRKQFPKKTSLAKHVRETHQQAVECKTKEGLKFTLQRDKVNLLFACICGFTNLDPDSVRRHVSRVKNSHIDAEKPLDPKSDESAVVKGTEERGDFTAIGEDAEMRESESRVRNNTQIGGNETQREITEETDTESGERDTENGENIVQMTERIAESGGDTEMADSEDINEDIMEDKVDEWLKDMRLGVLSLPQYGVLICTECRSAIDPDSVLSHLKKQHQLPKKQECEVVALLRRVNLKKPTDVGIPLPGGPPIEHLHIHDGFKCIDCEYSSVSEEVMKRHIRTEHAQNKDEINESRGYKSARVQAFFLAVGRRYFSVRGNSKATMPNQIIDLTPELIAQQLKIFDDFKAKQDSTVLQPNRFSADESPWMKRTGWMDHLKGVDLKRIRNEFELPQKGSQPNSDLIVKSVDRMFDHCLLLLKEKGSTWLKGLMASANADAHEAQLFQPLSDDTNTRYRLVWKRILVFLIRTVTNGMGWSTGLMVFNKDQESYLRDLAATLANNKRDVSEIDKAVFQLSYSIIAQTFNDTGSETCILMHCLSVLGIDRETTTFRKATCASHDLAAVLFNSRLLLLKASHELNTPGQEMWEKFGELHRNYLVPTRPTPICEVLSLLAWAKGIGRGESARPYTIWSFDEGEDTLFFRGDAIQLANFRKLAKGQILNCEKIIAEDFCMDINLFGSNLENIKDDPATVNSGYSFLTDSRNKDIFGGVKGRAVGLEALFENSKLAGKLCRVVEGKLIWFPGAIRALCASKERLLESILLAFHICGGQPARGSEITQITWANTMWGVRNVYLQGGDTWWCGNYHKVMGQIGHSKFIPRIFPKRLTPVFVIFISCILPLCAFLATQVPMPILQVPHDLSLAPRHFLFSSDGSTPWDTKRLTKALGRETERYLGVNIGVLPYRHIAICISRRFLKSEFQIPNADEDQDEYNLQAGHSSGVADRTYGVRGDILSSLSEHSIETFSRISRKWHTVILQEMVSTNPNIPKTTGKRMLETVDSDQVTKRMHVGLTEEALTAPSPEELARLDDLCTVECSNILRRIHGPNAVWKSENQQQALKAVLKKVSPLIIVLPTGGGKSLVFLGPASTKGSGVNVVILPFIALLNDLQKRAEKAGIKCQRWDPSSNIQTDTPLIFVTVEGAAGAVFKHYMIRLQELRRLDRVFVDEAHLLVTSADFRIKFRELVWLTSLRASTTYLTGTLPYNMQEDLEKAAGLDEATYIRKKGTHAHIQYNVYIMLWEEMTAKVVTLALEEPETPETRVLIYCKSVKACQHLSDILRCSIYHSKSENKDESLEDWSNGKNRTMVATSALGSGIDLPGVKLVIFYGCPWSFIDFMQGSGRGGRDGGRAACYVICCPKQLTGDIKGGCEKDQKAMRSYIMTEDCRRKFIGQYLDGEGFCCQKDKDEPCDICTKKALKGTAPIPIQSNTVPQAHISSRKTRISLRGKLSSSRILSNRESSRTSPDEAITPGVEHLREEGGEPTSYVDLTEHTPLLVEPQKPAYYNYQRKLLAKADIWKRFEQALPVLRDSCKFCFTGKVENDDGHRIEDCTRFASWGIDYTAYKQWRRYLIFENYSCCFTCLLPQHICQYGQACEYDGHIIAPIAFMAPWIPDIWSKITKIMGHKDEDVYQEWLCRKNNNVHGKEASNLVLVTLIAVVELDKNGT